MNPSLPLTCARALLAALAIAAPLLLPHRPGAFGWSVFERMPLELPVLLLLLLAAGRFALLRAAVVLALIAVGLQKGADLAMQTALGRPFNPLGDLPLIDALVRLLSATTGIAATLAILAGAFVAVVAAAAGLWWATGIWARPGPSRTGRWASLGATAFAALLLVADAGRHRGAWDLPAEIPGTSATTRMALERARMARETLRGVRDFAAIVKSDPFRGMDGLLDAIDRDVLIVFVESYGRASLDTPLYAPTHRATLEAAQARLVKRGLAMRSGYLASPISGGRSWLAHETLAGGLWTTDQARYLAALSSGRETLFHIAARSGFRSAAVMPAIQFDWPESRNMGFERVLAAADLGYAGEPFNWVTMPDQFTLAALDRLLRAAEDPRPLFAQVALISSHAPWVPVPDLVPWERIGDGRIFDGMALSGDAPSVVWRDMDRVRDQYRRAVDYSLRTVFEYAERHAADPPLMIVLGDHQSASRIARDERPDVPVHVIGPEHLVSRVAAWGWGEGLVPAEATESIRMDRMRGMILRAFTTGIADLAAR